MSDTLDGGIIVLGVCDRADYDKSTGKWNVLGFGNIVYSHIFPNRLHGVLLGINVPADVIWKPISLFFLNPSGEELGSITIGLEGVENLSASEQLANTENVSYSITGGDRIILFISLGSSGMVVHTPGLYTIVLKTNGGVVKLSTISLIFVPAPPINPERVAAIQSRPNAAKSVRMEIGCKHCSSSNKSYCSLERDDKKHIGYTWYEDIDDIFNCECGETKMDLQYIRSNLHALLGKPINQNEDIDVVPLYQKSSLSNTRRRFSLLLSESPKEEVLQSFIKETPILLHHFAAVRIIPKPKILSSYVADFAILSAQRELIFIELEKTTTKLMKKNGHRAAELIQAFDQVREWLHEVDEHRLAILHDLDIESKDVGIIRGVVIAGREKGYDAEKMRKLRMSREERITFMTFDDLLFSLDALIETF